MFVFTMLSLKLISKIDTKLDVQGFYPNVALPYILSYKYNGFSTRMFIGSIISIFTTYISTKTIVLICLVFHFIFYVFIAVLVYIILKKDTNFLIYKIVLLCIVFPFSTLLGGEHYYFTDEFLLFMMIISLISVNSKNKFTITFIPILIGLLAHTVFIFSYYPTIFICHIYKILNHDITTNNRIKRIIYLVFELLIILMAFMFLFFISSKNINVDNLKNTIFIHSNFKSDYIDEFLNFEYNMSLYEKFNNSTGVFINSFGNVLRVIITYFLDLCYLLPFLYIYKQSYKNDTNKYKKYIYILSLISIFSIIPLFIGLDFKRWIDYAISSQIVLMLFYLFNEEKIVSLECKNVFNKNIYIFCCALVIISIFNYEKGGAQYNPVINKLILIAKIIYIKIIQ